MAIANQTKTVVAVFHSRGRRRPGGPRTRVRRHSRDDISVVANKGVARSTDTGMHYDTEASSKTTDKTSDVVADAGIGAAIKPAAAG